MNLLTLASVELFSLGKGPSLLPTFLPLQGVEMISGVTPPFLALSWGWGVEGVGVCICPSPLPRPGMPSSSGSLDRSQSSWTRWNVKTSSQAKPKLSYFLAVFSHLLVVLLQGIMITPMINMGPCWLMHQIKINVHRKNSLPQEFKNFFLLLIFS